MLKKYLLIFFIFILLYVSIIYANNMTPCAIVLSYKGEIYIQRNKQNIVIENGKILYSKDKIISKEQSMAAIKFVDNGAIIKLFANSILTIDAEKRIDKLDKKLFLEIGNLWSQVTKKKGDYVIETPTTVASVKGTDFLTKVQENGETIISTFAGTVELTTSAGSIEVTEGNTGYANKDEIPKVETTKTSDILEDIIEEIKKSDDELNQESGVLEIELKNENGETKILKIHYK